MSTCERCGQENPAEVHTCTASPYVARLEAEVERERMRLTACDVVAMSDTPESAAKARDMHPDYRSAACDSVARRVDECIALRREVERLTSAIRWALGEEGEFPEEPEPLAGKYRRRFWWRSELRKRAALRGEGE